MSIKTEKTTAEVVENAIKTAVVTKSEEPTQMIYIGPNMLQLTAYTVVEGKFPLHIEGLIKNCPSIQKLFVPVKRLTTLEPRTKTKGTIEYRHYQNVLEFVAKKGRE